MAFKGGGSFTTKLTVSQCNEKAIVYCSTWQVLNGFDKTTPPSGDNAWDKLGAGCQGVINEPTGTTCKTILGIT